MGIKIGVTMLKGGCGKSTVSINIAVCLAHQGYKVCIVDTDENRNSVKWYGERDNDHPKILVVGTVDYKALDKTVDTLNAQYDFLIMDGTPSLGKMSSMIIASSDILIIPVRPGATDIQAMEGFVERVDKVRAEYDNIQAYFLLNEYNSNATFCRAIKAGLEEAYPTIPILESSLKSRMAYPESFAQGLGVMEYTDKKAKAEIEMLTKEILQHVKIETNVI